MQHFRVYFRGHQYQGDLIRFVVAPSREAVQMFLVNRNIAHRMESIEPHAPPEGPIKRLVDFVLDAKGDLTGGRFDPLPASFRELREQLNRLTDDQLNSAAAFLEPYDEGAYYPVTLAIGDGGIPFLDCFTPPHPEKAS